VKLRTLALAPLAAVAATLAFAGSALAEPTWAPADSATIHPGVQTFTEGAQCTSNFIFFDGSNNVYIGQAAHCSGTGGATETDGCLAGSQPLGTQVEIGGASRPGTMVYNSWIAMQEAGETDADTCGYNDFALVRIDPADAGKVNPSVPHWGGPNGLGSTGAGTNVFSYGNSSLRLGITQLSPKRGVSLGPSNGGWNHQVYTVTPGIPGDSGSGFLDGSGRAFGTLSTVAVAPLPASNGVGDLPRELAYMRSHSSFSGVQLAHGTEAFNGGRLPVGGLGVSR
jgi:hypothetical protein